MTAAEPKPPIPQTREAMAEALCAAMWGGPPLRPARYECAVDLVQHWLATTRAQALEEAAKICDDGVSLMSDLPKDAIKVISAPDFARDALKDAADIIRALAAKDAGQ